MYQKILVPMALNHGLSRQTLAIAKLLSGNGEGQVIAIHVYESPPSSASVYLHEKVVKEGLEAANLLLREKLSGLKDIKPELIKGHTYRSIIEYARNNEIDCIVMGSHKPGLSDYLLGSTAARVVRHAPCAVHVHRSS